jgi:hypothetical protein
MSLLKNTAWRLKLWRNDVLEQFTMMVVGERPSLESIAAWFKENCDDE